MADELPISAQPRVAAGALFFDAQRRVLLVKPNYKDGWDIPGGYVEPGETPVEACEREIREELGWKLQLSNLLAVDWAPSESEGDKILFVFDGGVPSSEALASIRLQSEELEGWAFHAVDAFKDLMPDRLARRLTHAVGTRATGLTAYLEHGDPV